ncbi:MAG: oxygen-independent coproporphyrinogen III oxidase [Deltaproteobacteria bacterium RBG_13_65_10]|nr:MAG: oxygen-independent coproporphyrinogen III oxidase [Deltaproteobacteria bacterium RBG_13_65_10]
MGPAWEAPVFDRELLRKYDRSGPRYTSYPTANLFHEGFSGSDYEALLHGSDREAPERPLSLYFHLPFCRTLCLFCACNVIWTKDQTRGDAYVDLLCREMDLVAQSISPGRKVTQLHWGGGTPTHSSAPVLERLFAGIRDRFAFDEDPEMGVELNPREMEPEHLEALARCGFKRASIGIQDFDPVVQAAVRRLQTESQTRSVVERCRALGFQSVNVDLIYGLPLQTVRSFEATIGSIVDLAPDRIALFNFAYLPQLIPHQRAIKAQMLPAPEVKLDILELAIERFTNAGYVYIGMDHFARPDDELTRALADRTLTRNFQGYTTKGGCDLLAFGVSGISQVGPCYAQNHKEYPSYQALIEGGKLPTERGILLSRDDELRWDVIRRLMCHFVVVKPEIELLYGIDFDDYFADSLRSLESMASDALVELAPDRITVRPLGRLLVRNVAMAFDSYLPSAKQATFSRTV